MGSISLFTIVIPNFSTIHLYCLHNNSDSWKNVTLVTLNQFKDFPLWFIFHNIIKYFIVKDLVGFEAVLKRTIPQIFLNI